MNCKSMVLECTIHFRLHSQLTHTSTVGTRNCTRNKQNYIHKLCDQWCLPQRPPLLPNFPYPSQQNVGHKSELKFNYESAGRVARAGVVFIFIIICMKAQNNYSLLFLIKCRPPVLSAIVTWRYKCEKQLTARVWLRSPTNRCTQSHSVHR